MGPTCADERQVVPGFEVQVEPAVLEELDTGGAADHGLVVVLDARVAGTEAQVRIQKAPLPAAQEVRVNFATGADQQRVGAARLGTEAAQHIEIDAEGARKAC